MENEPKSMMTCQYCKKVYTNKYTLNTHQKTAKACLKLQKNNTDIKCQYCEKTFSSQSSLNLHQKTNKTCHTKTNTNEQQQRELISFDCNGCDKTFTTKAALAKHNSICSNIKKYLKEKKELEEKLLNERNEKKELEEKLLNERKDMEEKLLKERNKITELYSKLKTLEKQLEKQETNAKYLQDRLIEKATTKTNTTTNNIVDLKVFLSQDDVNTKINQHFTKRYLSEGINGIVNFIVEKIAMDDHGNRIYKCTDSAREFFMYLDTEGNEVKDIKAAKLIEMTKPGLIEKTCQIQSKAQNEYKYLTDTYADETLSDDVKKRMSEYKNTSEQARDLITNKFYDDKFPAKISKELTKKLS
jgi:hypothetical protein